jgi:glyoxalase family protein
MTILGWHHLTLVCLDAQRTVDFYTGVLGQRFIKQTVNFDDPQSYHLYFGDELGRPGTAVTFFEWPRAPHGVPGIGGTHHLALTVADTAGLRQWKRRLTDLGVAVDGPLSRPSHAAIHFCDPDGVRLAIATAGPAGEAIEASDTWAEPVWAIHADMALMSGVRHVLAYCSDLERTDAFFGGLLGLERVETATDPDEPGARRWTWGVDGGRPGTLLSYAERDPAATGMARIGIGQTHHFALAVPDEAVQREWREALLKAGMAVTPVIDRVYFKSIYTRDPDDHIVELATLGPGFTVDESPEELGTALRLPPWLEGLRGDIERGLRPISVPPWQPPADPPRHPHHPPRQTDAPTPKSKI